MNIKNNSISNLLFGNNIIEYKSKKAKITSGNQSCQNDNSYNKCIQSYFRGAKMSNINFKGAVSPADNKFLNDTETQLSDLTTDLGRQNYLFSTAKLIDTCDSTSIYNKYPELQNEKTFHKMKTIYDNNSDDVRTQRLFQNILETHIDSKTSEDSDKIDNVRDKINIDVSDLGLKNKKDEPVDTIKYRDVSGWLQNTKSNDIRKEINERQRKSYVEQLQKPQVALFNKNIELMSQLGYPQQVDFYSKMNGHNLRHLSDIGGEIIDKTDKIYNKNMGKYFKERTGKDFSQADRADVSFVIAGPDPKMDEINSYFPEDRLVPLAEKTFDGLGLDYSSTAHKVDYKSLDEYKKDVIENKNTEPRIILDITKRPGKESRAYMDPLKIPSEIYLSVKPEGGLDDYSAFLHESGHSEHFVHANPENSFAQNILGNNSVTETYAYLFEKMLMNKHWLKNMAGLSDTQAKKVVKQQGLADLYMVRRYSGKMQFETKLLDQKAGKDGNINTKNAGKLYSNILTKSTGFKFSPDMWSNDIDPGFYVADYFTAWTLEAQLDHYLKHNYGTKENKGEDWYTNPKAGKFLEKLWSKGNPGPQKIANMIGSKDPNDPTDLIHDINDRLAD